FVLGKNGIIAVVGKLHFGCTVAVHAPSHAERGILVYFVFLLYVSVTGLALYLTYFHVLRVVKIYIVGQVMDLNPFDGTRGLSISFLFRVPAGIVVQFVYFCSTIYRFAVGIYKCIARIRINYFVAVHTDIRRRDHRVAALFRSGMAI